MPNNWAYKCPIGGVQFAENGLPVECGECGAEHLPYHAAGWQDAIPKVEAPMVPPRFHPQDSLVHGCRLESWGDYHKANKRLGLVDVGYRPPIPGREPRKVQVRVVR